MSLLPSVNYGSTNGPLFIPIDGAVNPFPIQGPAGNQGPVGPQGPQGVPGINSFGSWYYAAGAGLPAPQTIRFDGNSIYLSLVSIPPGGAAYLYMLQTQFNSTAAMTLYINSSDAGGSQIGFTASVTAIQFFEGLGYAQFDYILIGPAAAGFVVGNVVEVFDGGGTVGPQGPQGPQGIQGPIGADGLSGNGSWVYNPAGGDGTWRYFGVGALSVSTVTAYDAWLTAFRTMVDAGTPMWLAIQQGALSQRFLVDTIDSDPGILYLQYSQSTAAPLWIVGADSDFIGFAQGAQGPAGSPANAATWATFPAVQNVDVSGYNITNVNTVNATTTNTGSISTTTIDCYQNLITGFGTLQVGSPNPIAANPGVVAVNGTLAVQRGFSNFLVNAGGVEFDGTSSVPGPVPLSQGIKFGMLPVSGVNTSRFEMNTALAPAGAIVATSPSFITLNAVGAANITSGIDTTVSAGGVMIVESAAKNIRLQGSAGSYSDVHMFGGTLDGMGNITGQASGVAIGNVGSLSGVGAAAIDVGSDLSGGAGVDYRTQGDIVSNSAGSTPNSLNTLGTRVRFRDSTEFFVSNNGNDITGDGSQLNPYATIQKAITQAELISSAALICIINVSSGHYTENLTFAKGYVIINGVLSTQTAGEVTEITGSVTISCAGAADLFNRMVGFQGVNLTCGVGQSVTDNSTTSHAVFFQDSKISSNGRFFNGISTGADARTYITNCEISQTNAAVTDSTIYINRGAVEIERIDVTTDGNAPCLEIAGNAVVFRCSLSTFENTNVSATVAPICLITTSSLAIQPFGQCTFTYTSGVSKAASPTSSAIRVASGVNTNLALLNNYYTLNGLIGSGNNVITYNGVGSPVLVMNDNRSLSIPLALPATTTIQAGFTKVNYTDINGPAAGSYSSSVSQPIAVGGTPQAITFNTTEKQFNTSLVASTRIYALASGTFRFDYTVQLQNTSGGDQTTKIWIVKNGTNVPRSASQIVISNNGESFPCCVYTLDLIAGDYLEVVFQSASTNVRALAVAAVVGPPAVPAVPSIIANLTQVGS